MCTSLPTREYAALLFVTGLVTTRKKLDADGYKVLCSEGGWNQFLRDHGLFGYGELLEAEVTGSDVEIRAFKIRKPGQPRENIRKFLYMIRLIRGSKEKEGRGHCKSHL